MSRHKNTQRVHWSDPSKEAGDYLNVIMNEDSKSMPFNDEVVIPDSVIDSNAIDIQEALSEQKIIKGDSGRKAIRILFITKDESVLQADSPAFSRITDLRHAFAEVHVLLLNFRQTNGSDSIFHPFETVWLYTTESTAWWKLSFDGYRVATRQLTFAGGLRADFVIAEDPFESGLVGLRISKHFKRPMQLHLYDDCFDDSYIDAYEHPTLYTWCMHYVINSVTSLRTKTELLRQEAIRINPKLEKDTELLPNYYDLTTWRDFVPTMSLHERYPQFKFIILHISSMQNSSHSKEALLGISPLLRQYPTIGLVVVGNGPLRSKLEKLAITLGLQNQIEFETMPKEILSHLHSANVLVHISEDESEDELVLSAAVAKIPVVASSHGIIGKLFSDGESMQLCNPNDIACITRGVNLYLNSNLSRTQYTHRAYDTVFERVEQDYSGYLNEYIDSIKRSLTIDS